MKINFPKLFLASNSNYLTYTFSGLGDTKYSFGLSFMAVDTGEMQGACVGGQAEETNHSCKSKWAWGDMLFEKNFLQEQVHTT